MIKKIFFVLILVFSLLLVTGTVCGAEVKDTGSNNTTSPIKKISISKPTFKAGTTVTIKVITTKSIRSVFTSITGKSGYSYKLKKSSSSSIWYYNLKTKGLKTGKYKLNIKAVDFKKKTYRSYVYLAVDNVAPKIQSLKSSASSITAGTPFSIEAITDKTSKKVVAKVSGKTIFFKSNPINLNNTKGYNNSNSNNWTFTGKISYKEVGILTITVYVYDSVGNVAKKTLYINSYPRYVYWNGTLLMDSPIKVYYSNPANAYQKSIDTLNKYVKVYEGYAGNRNTLGITYYNGFKATKVIIAYKDPFVVYHEMGHVLNWQWSEYQCDLFAYKKVGYWIL